MFQKVLRLLFCFLRIFCFRVLFSHEALSENILNLNYYLFKSDGDEILSLETALIFHYLRKWANQLC